MGEPDVFMKAVEKYYSIAELALLVGLSTKTITVKMRAKEFGDGVVNLGSVKPGGEDFRVPASGFNAWLDSRRLFSQGAPEPGIVARSKGELRRKAAVFSENGESGVVPPLSGFSKIGAGQM